MNTMKRVLGIAAVAVVLPFGAWGGEEVELSSAAVTALSCAKEVRKSGKLELLSSCPYAEAVKGYVVYDVAEKQIYSLSEKGIFFHELESAFGGGSIDLTGQIVETRDGIPVVEVKEYSINPKPKPGSFKGCL